MFGKLVDVGEAVVAVRINGEKNMVILPKTLGDWLGARARQA